MQILVTEGSDITVGALQAGKLGETVSLLSGHRAVVSFVEFCPVIPHALLSCSFDGTCRIWNATNAAVEPVVLRATPSFAAGPCHSTRGAQESQAVHVPMANPVETIIVDGEDSHVSSIPVRSFMLGNKGRSRARIWFMFIISSYCRVMSVIKEIAGS